jgi:ATP-dependent Clp protease ATP-binding subunit ClpX
MKKLTKDDIPNTWQTEMKAGVYAEFDDDGFVTHYGFYADDNDTVEEFTINIDYEKRTSIVEKYDERRFLAFDPALDVDDKLSLEEAFTAFAQKWIGVISQEGSHSPPDCSFCGRNSNEVEKLIAGPRSFICNDCIETCAQMLKSS